MSSFTRPLTVTKIDSRTWEVTRAFKYHVGEEGSGNVVSVPKGFWTDFASIPRPFWVIFPPDGKYTQAAVVHDYLYSKKKRDRKECDDIFLEAMKVLGVRWLRRMAIYSAVRSFGWLYWNKED